MGEIVSDVVGGLSPQYVRNHEATDDEKHVDTDVATLKAGDLRVIKDDENDRDRAKSLDVRTKALVPALGQFRLTDR